MDAWKNVLTEIFPDVIGDRTWEATLTELISSSESHIGIHLAIFSDPYLEYILEGKKTIESRFGARRIAPYGKVSRGDVILLKKTGGPIVGLCKVTNVGFYALCPESLREIRNKFSEALCAEDQEFWNDRQAAAFATLMSVNNVLPIRPIKFQKRDRRGWVVLRTSLINDAQYYR